MSRPIIIDTDPGQDDAVALLLAFASPELEVLGVTTVAGNVPLPLTTKNARMVCELAGQRGVTICAGAERPLLRPLVTAEYVHGKTGLDGPVLPEPTMPIDARHAADFIIETVMNRQASRVTLCPLGPLTNIALALAREPRIAPRLREIVLMGGGYFEQGNVTPSAEFNIYVDPHAADIVFRSGVPITMVPLDVTHKAVSTRARVDAIRAIGSRAAEVTAGWLDFFERYDVAKYGSEGGPLHDPCVIAWLIKPDLFTGRSCNVEIETSSSLTLGATVIDWWGVTDRPKNAYVLGGIDADGFFDLLTRRIAKIHGTGKRIR